MEKEKRISYIVTEWMVPVLTSASGAFCAVLLILQGQWGPLLLSWLRWRARDSYSGTAGESMPGNWRRSRIWQNRFYGEKNAACGNGRRQKAQC